MLNKLLSFIREHKLLSPGDSVVCAVSGGADSVALLFALYLLREKLGISLSAAHFNHNLRGEESLRDERFVRQLCDRYDIPLTLGRGIVVAGKKGLEAAARDARYAFLNSIPGKIATAHTADDNAETVLMHLVRGTGLKGLGGIAPKNGRLIRPMLSVTRQEVLAFLQEYNLSYITDSSNETDNFLRNRLRHHVMPLLKKENPRFAENTSATALRLRQDAAALESLSANEILTVSQLCALPEAVRNRAYGAFLKSCGVLEPEAEHIRLLHKLASSDNPSAKGNFPGGITIVRNYAYLQKQEKIQSFSEVELPCPGEVALPEIGVQIRCDVATEFVDSKDAFTVTPAGKLVIRSRKQGDCVRLSGGTKSLKKLFIDKKIPAAQRERIPVIADEAGVVAVCGLGASKNRLATQLPAFTITITKIKGENEL